MTNLSEEYVSLLAKRRQASKAWMLLDANGNTWLLPELNNYKIMHRAGIHARDIRILDPLLSYPFAILGRERAIVLNFEHIKAIITAEEVLLRDPMNEFVIPVVEELCRRLPIKGSDTLGHEGAEGEGKDLNGNVKGAMWSPDKGEQDDKMPGTHVPPFELRVLAVAFEAICCFLDARTFEFESEAYPALDELTEKISSLNLNRLRNLKSTLSRLTARVQKVKDELGELLDDDDDMADLCLTRKMLSKASSPLASSGVPKWAPTSATSATRVSRSCKSSGVTSFNYGAATTTDSDDVDELYLLLEDNFMQIVETLNKLITLQKYVDDTVDYIKIQVDNRRNKLIQLELILSSAGVIEAVFALVTGFFGMNIPFVWNEGHAEAFTWVVVAMSITSLAVFITVLSYLRHKHLLFT